MAKAKKSQGNVGMLLIILIAAIGLYLFFTSSIYQSWFPAGVADINSDNELMAASGQLDSNNPNEIDSMLSQNDSDISAF